MPPKTLASQRYMPPLTTLDILRRVIMHAVPQSAGFQRERLQVCLPMLPAEALTQAGVCQPCQLRACQPSMSMATLSASQLVHRALQRQAVVQCPFHRMEQPLRLCGEAPRRLHRHPCAAFRSLWKRLTRSSPLMQLQCMLRHWTLCAEEGEGSTVPSPPRGPCMRIRTRVRVQVTAKGQKWQPLHPIRSLPRR